MVPWPVIKFCCEEVERQRTTPINVLWLIEAWESARAMYHAGMRGERSASKHFDPQDALTPELIEQWGRMIDPPENQLQGFRRLDVWIGDHKGADPDDIRRQMANLFKPESLRALDPANVYREFEEIHPFQDGNGRTGKLIFNWLRGTLDDPIMPPNYWGVANP